MLVHQNKQPNFNRLIQVFWQHPEYSPEQAARVLQQWEEQQWERAEQQGGERQGNIPGREQQSPAPDPQQAQPQPPNPPGPLLGAPQQPPQQMPGQPAPAKASNLLAFNLDKTRHLSMSLSGISHWKVWLMQQESYAKESLALTQEMEGSLALHPTLSVTASKQAKYDHNLAFLNFLYAKCNFLIQIKHAKWPPAVVDSFNLFFYSLENHVLRQQAERGEKILLHYATVINNVLMDTIMQELHSKELGWGITQKPEMQKSPAWILPTKSEPFMPAALQVKVTQKKPVVLGTEQTPLPYLPQL
ncbi:hypothetical protein ID866_9977 [Astraeus odoratus]|nr:hypothetical protein ID866_9977 [Astraeus odoratus]